jgi:CHRD domain
MNARRGVALAAALGLTATLGAAVPLAVAKKGGNPGKPGKPAKPAKPGKAASKVLFDAVLSGRNEVGPDRRKKAGDLDGQGLAALTVKGSNVCFAIVTQGIGTVTAAHIHAGKKGKSGPPVLLLPTAGGQAGDPGAFSYCVSAASATYNFGLDLNRLRNSPERYYVNVHTSEYPNGAIRGQLRRRSASEG